MRSWCRIGRGTASIGMALIGTGFAAGDMSRPRSGLRSRIPKECVTSLIDNEADGCWVVAADSSRMPCPHRTGGAQCSLITLDISTAAAFFNARA
jgi:hypothetical protein